MYKIKFLINNPKFIRVFYQFRFFYKLKNKIFNRKKSFSCDRKKIPLRKKSKVLNTNNLITMFRQLKLNDNIFLHRFNKLKNGNTTLFDALVIYKYKNLLIPYFPIKQSYYTDTKVDNYFERKCGVGSFAEYINKEKINKLKKSIHLSHTIISLGKDNDFLVRDHKQSITPFDKKSPFFKALLYDFDVLLIGVDLNKLTSVHIYEDLFGSDSFLPIYSNKNIKADIFDFNKIVSTTTTKIRHSTHILRNVELMRKKFLEDCAMRIIKYDNYEMIALNIRKLTFVLMEELLVGNSIYGKLNLTKSEKLFVSNKIKELKQNILEFDNKRRN